ncbi:phosphoribosylaminoimidazolecarboxamide formyltransferase / IMP cyclohydrolase [Desulfonauticus submarinus]|uniref:Phosphoribosylaminoimidazolecarboxamide formyltransferase / IMP cyclohydrolase n=1 Tax=Desulfonauticus submarinus TaxID=206665 RepID=A0A1H0GLF0_9BACT|nr:IMP cyclohydrolase [Desulfonauticus submarinus]SDO07710.1 phosphoribosylaminoimidazolecarboxamide formyltransferase / IMP cyclohydrolase [Desulfonauticus submarinus]
MEILPIKRAILSVTDKSGLPELAQFLQKQGVEIISTGGTKRILEQNGIKVISISEITNFPEILDGRVKTLHPHVHAGILADKDNPQHHETLKTLNLDFFDLICVNLYNFKMAIDQSLSLRDAIEQIDIGGPTLLRAGAKNFHSVCVLPDPKFYSEFQQEYLKHQGISIDFRKKMAAYTFNLTSNYDRMISDYLSHHTS